MDRPSRPRGPRAANGCCGRSVTAPRFGPAGLSPWDPCLSRRSLAKGEAPARTRGPRGPRAAGWSGAPTGRHTSAWGNAPGNANPQDQALKGRPNPDVGLDRPSRPPRRGRSKTCPYAIEKNPSTTRATQRGQNPQRGCGTGDMGNTAPEPQRGGIRQPGATPQEMRTHRIKP
jgi:hypothetical protein